MAEGYKDLNSKQWNFYFILIYLHPNQYYIPKVYASVNGLIPLVSPSGVRVMVMQ